MADNPENTSARDRSRISAEQPYEVEYVHKQFPWFSHQEIIDAIKKNGPDRETVIQYLSRMSNKEKTDQD